MNNVATPLVSVVIPTYNHAQYLGRALQSVCDQTYKNWEAIVIDNHSADGTDKVMASFTDPRITYIQIHNHGVIALSRNSGIRVANGEWIAFLDSDDWWTNDKLQVCLDAVNEKVDFVYHAVEIISDKTSRIFRRKVIKSWQVKAPVLMDLLQRGNAMVNSSVIVRKSLVEKIGGIKECKHIIAAEDYHTWMCIAKFTDNFLYLPLRLGYYLSHDKNVSKKDMSIPVRHAVAEFIGMLSDKQKLKLEASLSFTSLQYKYSCNNYIELKRHIIFILANACVLTKIKTSLIVAYIYICKIKIKFVSIVK
jgi:glycosyltransferase involved in cell wall biosynthesis